MGCLDILLWEVPVQAFCRSFYGLSVVFLLIRGAHFSIEGNACRWSALTVICMSMLASLGFQKEYSPEPRCLKVPASEESGT